MPTVRELKRHLRTYLKDDDVIAWDIWTVSDVEEEVGRLNDKRDDDEPEVILTQGEMKGIIEDMHRYKDCEYGLTWDGIIGGIDEAIRRKEKVDG